MTDMPRVTLFTDGACSGNPGPGGWGCVLRTPEGEVELSGGETATTNNRMEMLAALRGLEELADPSHVELWTDSQYLRNGITSWIHNWMRKGWRTASGEPVKNEDLWRELWEQTRIHEIEWRWVRGHDGNSDNERCDRLAVAAVVRARKGDTEILLKRVGLDDVPRKAATVESAAVKDGPRKAASRGKSAVGASSAAAEPGFFQEETTAVKGRNLELKLPCRALDEVKRRAGTLGGKLDSRLSQDDQFYSCADGTRLKLRREIRHLPDGQALPRAELIRYLREDTGEARVSEYERTPVANPEALHEELRAAHGLGLLVRKGRELVLIGRTRLHLDAVAGLGTFVELELVLKEGEDPVVARAELERIIRGLGLYGVPAEPRAYADLLQEKLAQ